MISLFSWFLIPALTLMAAGGDLMNSNLSSAGSQIPHRYFLIFWAAVTGFYFRLMIRRIARQSAALFPAERELHLTDLALAGLLFSVLFPYLPEENRLWAAVHVLLAFCSSVLYFLVLTSLTMKLYFLRPKRFSGCAAALIYSIFAAAALFLAGDFIITGMLEIFITAFSSALLWHLCKKTFFLAQAS